MDLKEIFACQLKNWDVPKRLDEADSSDRVSKHVKSAITAAKSRERAIEELLQAAYLLLEGLDPRKYSSADQVIRWADQFATRDVLAKTLGMSVREVTKAVSRVNVGMSRRAAPVTKPQTMRFVVETMMDMASVVLRSGYELTPNVRAAMEMLSNPGVEEITVPDDQGRQTRP